ncbi:MAG: M23 family metallopeptidase [Candidatus Pacebacteria bacterium]|nr:M23 family metallopeptidase [Candidatus Paceibacterota bacterium]
MIKLPPIFEYVVPRPLVDGKISQFVPSEEYSEFWEAFYATLSAKSTFQFPLPGHERDINPLFGFFGPRYHPVVHKSDYFHAGIDITAPAKTPVLSVMPGVLEYAGFGIINGNYILISHPEIVTEDGFVFHSMYMHLRDMHVRFSSYQKMLREISLHTYPHLSIALDTKIGTVGSTGNTAGRHTHLHLQCEFRDKKGRSILIDPCALFGSVSETNRSAFVQNREDFQALLVRERNIIEKYKLGSYWEESDSVLE